MRIYLSPLIVYKENSPIYESALHDLGMRAIRWTALGNMYGRQQEITSALY